MYKLLPHGIAKIARISLQLMPTLHTFDICIYQSPSCVTTKYLIDICSSYHKWIFGVQILLSS